MEDNIDSNNLPGCGWLFICIICDFAWKIYYADKYNNYKILLWSVPIYIVLFAIYYWYVNRTK